MTNIIDLYIKYGSMKEVSRILGISIKDVKEVVIRECGPLYTRRGVCRAYLAMRNRCVVSVNELSTILNTSYHTALYIAKQLLELCPMFKLIKVSREAWRIKRIPLYYIVKDTQECIEEFKRRLVEEAGSSDVLRWVQWS